MATKTENRKVYISINGNEVKNTYRGIRKEVSKLRGQLMNLTPGTEKFKKKARELSVAEKHFEKVRKEIGFTNRSLRGSQSLLGGLKGMIAGAFTLGAIQQLTSRVISVRSEFERYFAVLKTSLGSSKAANKEFAMIRDFAAETPFSVRELTDSFVKLTNQGFKPTRSEMRKLGDLAASTGKQYDQLAEAIIDAQTGEFERLKEFGIRAKKEGDKVTFTFKEQQTQVDFTSDAIQEYILGLGDLQGVSGSMAEISETLGGKISNLGDSWDTLLYNLGESDAFGDTVEILGKMVSATNELLESPMSEKLREERIEMNALFEVLKDGNITQNQRNELISEINQDYGQYLENQLSEKSNLEEIDAAQVAANASFKERITLLATQEKQQKIIERAAEAQMAIFDIEKKIAETREKIKADPSQSDYYVETIEFLSKQIGFYKNEVSEAEQELITFNSTYSDMLAKAHEQSTERVEEEVKTRKKATGKDLESRQKAQAKIESFLTKAAGSEEEKVREKYQKFIDLAEKYGLETKDLIDAMNADIIEAVQEEALEEIEEQRKKQEKALKEAEKHAKEKQKVREKYGVLSDKEMLSQELAELKSFYDQDLLTFDEYQEAKAAIEDQHREETAEKEKDALRKIQKERLQQAQAYAGVFMDIISSLKQAELNNVREVAKEDFEVTRRRGETEEQFVKRKEAAEKKYTQAKKAEEEKRHEIAKRYAVMEALAAVSQIGIQTALAVMEAAPNVGLMLAMGLLGAAQAGLALQEVDKIKGYHEGGITKGLGFTDSSGYQVAGVVHEEEQVIPKWMRQSPMYAPTLDALEYARANNVGRYDQGGVVGGGPSKIKASTSLDASGFSEAVLVFEQTVKELTKGVPALIGDKEVRRLRKLQTEFEQIESNA